MMLAGNIAFCVVGAVAIYFWWLRPVLRTIPALDHLYLETDNFWRAVRLRFAGIKGKLLIALNTGVLWFIAAHDFILANTPGIDWSPVTSKVPGWVWPFVLLVDFWLLKKFRELTDRRLAAGEPK